MAVKNAGVEAIAEAIWDFSKNIQGGNVSWEECVRVDPDFANRVRNRAREALTKGGFLVEEAHKLDLRVKAAMLSGMNR